MTSNGILGHLKATWWGRVTAPSPSTSLPTVSDLSRKGGWRCKGWAGTCLSWVTWGTKPKLVLSFSTTHGALMGGSHGSSRGAIGLLLGSSLVSHVPLFWESSGDALTSKKAQKEALSGSLASCPCTPTAYVAPGASAVLRGYENLRGHGGSKFTAKFSGRPPDQRSAALEILRIPVDGGSQYLR
jgi:hypothetical protein